MYCSARSSRLGSYSSSRWLHRHGRRGRQGFGIIGNHGVEVESLRVGEVGVGDGNGDGGPIGTEPAAETVGVVAGSEVVVPGFGVALLLLEFVDVAGSRGVGSLYPEGVEVGVIQDGSAVVGDHASGAEIIGKVVVDGVCGIAAGDARVAEEYVFVEARVVGIAGEVSFIERVGACAIPIQFAVGFLDAAAVAVIQVGHTSGRSELAFGIPYVGVDAVARGVAGGVIRKA